MTKYIFLMSLLIPLFAVNSGGIIEDNFFLKLNQTITVNSDEPDEIVLDKDEVCIPCPPGQLSNEDSDCDIDMFVLVSAEHSDDRNFQYKYTVSGGRIIGEGGKVNWDLTGAPPGTYRISIDIENKSAEFQKNEIKVVTVTAQDCGGVCVCPTLSAVAPVSPIKAGETMIFTADVSGGSGEMVTYDWTISDGKIIEGQGTPVLVVATNAKMVGKTIKATIDISGVCDSCPRTAEASGLIAKPKRRKK